MSGSRLKIVVYSSGVSIDYNVTDFIKHHEGLSFDTFYPGGLYGSCSFFVAGDPTKPHPSFGTKRIEILDGLRVVWEGQVEVLRPSILGGMDGWGFECTGYWGSLLARTRWDKVWCDKRLTEDKWVQSMEQEYDMYRMDRYNRIRVTPVETTFADTNETYVTYTMPTGQTINRIIANYDLQEGTQDWKIMFYDWTGGSYFGTIQSTGTGTFYGTPAASCGSVAITFYSGTAQTVDYAGSPVYMQVTNIKVYGEAGTISSTEIVKDIVGHFTDLNADVSYVASNTVTHEPCFMEWEATTDFVSKLAAYGDSSYNPWAAGLLASSVAGTPNGKPVMFFEQQAALTGYDYVLRLDEIEGEVTIDQIFDEIWNRLTIEYTDSNEGRITKSYLDDATLEDGTSGTAYGYRYRLLKFGSTGETESLNYARRYLAWFKDPKWRMSSPITVKGTIRTAGRNKVPVCWVQAGQRVMIENYLQEMDGAGITFLITSTTYDEDSETLTINAGSPDPLATLVARMRR